MPREFLTLLLALGLLVPGPVGASDFVHHPRDFLKNDAGLTEAEFGELDRGQVVIKILNTTDRSEVMSCAVVRVNTTVEKVRRLLRDPETRRKDFEVIEIGKLPGSPSAQDLESLTLDPGDVEGLRKCRVGNCTERLPADAIRRFQTEMDWASPDHVKKANGLWRETLASYARDYLARGDQGLVEYDDNREPTRIADQLRALVLRSYYLKESAPDLHRYLSEFPASRPEGTDDVFFWLKERFWLKNVQSLNHICLKTATLPSGRVLLASTKQLFANHFFDASLDLVALVEDSAPAGSYLIYVNRTRADIRPSGFNWLERAIVRRLVTRRLLRRFRAFKAKLDPSYILPPDEEELREAS